MLASNANNLYLRAILYRDGQARWAVWLTSNITGDKEDCLGTFPNKRSAIKVQRAWNKRQDAERAAIMEGSR